jgi:hypothetical protein
VSVANRPLHFAARLVAAWAVASVAHAQDALPPTTAEMKPTAADEAVLRERNREALHPGDPLRLSGREENGNDLRSRTPALAHTDREIVYVDEDEAYRRKLAMYEEGARFTVALPRAPDAANARPTDAPTAIPARARRTAAAPAPAPDATLWPLWVGMGALALALAFRALSPRIAARLAERDALDRRRLQLAALTPAPTNTPVPEASRERSQA